MTTTTITAPVLELLQELRDGSEATVDALAGIERVLTQQNSRMNAGLIRSVSDLKSAHEQLAANLKATIDSATKG